jgi:Amidase
MIPAAMVASAQKFRRWYRDRVLALFDEVDAILAPATPCTAPLLGQQTFVVNGVGMPVRANLGLYTQPISSGCPWSSCRCRCRRCRSGSRSSPRRGARTSPCASPMPSRQWARSPRRARRCRSLPSARRSCGPDRAKAKRGLRHTQPALPLRRVGGLDFMQNNPMQSRSGESASGRRLICACKAGPLLCPRPPPICRASTAARCCAHAVSGHAAALPRPAMNTRRLIIRSPDRRSPTAFLGW